MKYCLGLVIDPIAKKILLLKRNKEPYNNCYNGIGGKIEEGESEYDALIRELKEEAEIIDVLKIVKLVTLIFPNNIELNVFYIFVNNIDFNDKNTREGILIWKDINFLLDINNNELAGDGNLTYFMKFILNLEKNLLN